MADFDLKDTILTRLGENYDLHDKYVNRTLVKVQPGEDSILEIEVGHKQGR